jgi:hypothetical protein
MTDEINWSMLDVTQEAQERAKRTIEAARRVQAIQAIELIVVHGVAPEVVARRCGFDPKPVEARASAWWGLDDGDDDAVTMFSMFTGRSPAKPQPLAEFSAWLQKQLAEIVAEGATIGTKRGQA